MKVSVNKIILFASIRSTRDDTHCHQLPPIFFVHSPFLQAYSALKKTISHDRTLELNVMLKESLISTGVSTHWK